MKAEAQYLPPLTGYEVVTVIEAAAVYASKANLQEGLEESHLFKNHFMPILVGDKTDTYLDQTSRVLSHCPILIVEHTCFVPPLLAL